MASINSQLVPDCKTDCNDAGASSFAQQSARNVPDCKTDCNDAGASSFAQQSARNVKEKLFYGKQRFPEIEYHH
jgi:hypothetical protein